MSLEQCQKMLQDNPNTPDLHFTMVKYYHTSKNYPKAIEHYNKVTKDERFYPDAQYNLGMHYSDQKEYPKAIEHFKNVPQYSDLFGQVYEPLKKMYLKSKGLETTVPNALKETSSIHSKMRRNPFLPLLKQATPAAAAAPSPLPKQNSKRIDFERGTEFFEQKKEYTKAIECYDKVLLVNPNHGGTLANLGQCYRLLKKYSEAIEHDSKISGTDQHDPRGQANIATCYYEQGNWNKAIEIASKIQIHRIR